MSSAPINEIINTPGPGLHTYGVGWAGRPFDYTVNANKKLDFRKRSFSANGDGFRPTYYFHCRLGYTVSVDEVTRQKVDSFTYVTNVDGQDTARYSFNDPVLPNFNIYRETPIGMPDRTKLDQLLLGRLAESGVSIGAMVAEMGETVSYLSTRVTDIVQIGRAVYTGQFNTAVKKLGYTRGRWSKKFASKDIAARWLELNFAIKPLVADINDMIQLYTDPDKIIKTFALKAQVTLPHVEEEKYVFDRVGFNSYTLHAKSMGRIRTKCVYSISNAESLAAKALGINSPAASLWEAVPFSWIIDYAVSVGKFLDALGATEGLSFVHGFYSYSMHAKYTYKQDYNFSYGAGPCYRHNSGIGFATGYLRLPYSAFPWPKLQFVLADISLRKISYVSALVTLFVSDGYKYQHKL